MRTCFLVILSLLVSVSALAEDARWLRYPSISPDGQSVAFSYKGDVYVVDVQGGEARQLTSNPAHDYAPVWSPDSKTIAYTSRKKTGVEQTKSTDSDIYLYTIISGETKAVEPTNEAKATKRSLVSFNKNGISTLFDSLKLKKTFKIDEYFAPFVLGTLKLLCEEYKINVIYSPSPLEPSQICAVYFPETERLFADSRFFEQTSENKENLELIHRNRFSLEYALKENKEKLNFISKTEKYVLAEAKEYLGEAMVYHSLLEGIYSPTLDKNALDCLAQSLIVSLFK